MLLISCAAPARRVDDWSTMETACNRLTITWTVPTAELRDIIGNELMPAGEDGEGDGRLALVLLSCPQSMIKGRPSGMVSMAQVVIPLDGLPWTMAGKGLDTYWCALAAVVGDPQSRPIRYFGRIGFAVVAADDVTLEVATDVDQRHVRGAVLFDDGRIDVVARFDRRSTAVTRNEGLVHPRRATFTPAVGVTSMQHAEGEASVRLSGTTPLSDLSLSERPVQAELDQDVRWLLGSVVAAGP